MKKCLNEHGFTLVELIVVIAILSVLSVSGIIAYRGFLERAKNIQALTQLKKFQVAIDSLASDTEQWPGPNPVGELATKEVWDLSKKDAGLVDSNNKFDNWHGPYIDSIPLDPWGMKYFFDPDYRIGGQRFVVIGSFGPNKTGRNTDDGDNVYLILSAF